jgi:hypothetical protein
VGGGATVGEPNFSRRHGGIGIPSPNFPTGIGNVFGTEGGSSVGGTMTGTFGTLLKASSQSGGG